MRDLATAALVLRGTLRRKGLSLLWFALGAGAFHWLVAASFPAIGGEQAVTSVIRTFPEGLRSLLKLAPNLQAGFGVQDYLAFTWMHPLFIGLGAAFVVSRATDALAGQIEGGAVYLVLSRPVARWAFVLGKAGEMALGAGVIALAGWIGLALGASSLPYSLPLERYLLAAGTAWLIFAALGGGAFAIGSLCSRAGLSNGLGTAWTLVAFVLDVIPQAAGSPLAALNPWHYYFPQEVVATGRVDPMGVGVLLAWLMGGVAVAAGVWERRDLA
jgi:ABC-type transport system involved in multi-copper enzyme maturation permease subunit